MATLGVDFAGPYLNLTESETKGLATAEDVGSYISGLVTLAAAAMKALPVAVISGLLTAYLKLENKLATVIDQGAGITLHLPWPAIWYEAFWFIYPTPNSVTLQDAWWWCSRCSGLYWSGTPKNVGGVCPAGGQHGQNNSSNYKLAMGAPTSPGQHDWRWCTKCSGLFWAGGSQNAGACPAGGAHGPRSSSSDYAIDMDDPSFSGQHGWKFCGKCNGLFWGSSPGGACPAHGAHQQGGSSDYALMN
jgi:hypothetical protein